MIRVALLSLIVLSSTMILLPLEQSGVANAVIVHTFPNSDINTDRLMVPQANSIFQYQKTHLSAEQYRNITEGLGKTMENATNACNSPFASFLPQAQKACNFYVPFLYVICQADAVKQSLFECSNPGLSDYISSHGIKNPEANVRYAFENQQRTTGNATDIFSHDKSFLFK